VHRLSISDWVDIAGASLTAHAVPMSRNIFT
jgi:hypothetical protein